MPPFLFERDFDGEVGVVDLSTHDAGWVYAGASNRYQAWPPQTGDGSDGFGFAAIGGAANSIASHDYTVPEGTSVGIVADVRRGNVDAVGGAIEVNLYYRNAARGTTDLADRLQLQFRRAGVGGGQMVATWNKAVGVPGLNIVNTPANITLSGG
jgi:hypothetical protein